MGQSVKANFSRLSLQSAPYRATLFQAQKSRLIGRLHGVTYLVVLAGYSVGLAQKNFIESFDLCLACSALHSRRLL